MTAAARTRSPRQPRQLRSSRLAGQIRDYIAAHHLRPGSALPSEADIASQYEVSLRVVRDALRELAELSVIRTHQGKRAEVANLRPTALRRYFLTALESHENATDDIVELNIAIESSAARMAATRITARDLEALRRHLCDPIGFHATLLRSANNRFLRAVSDALIAAANEYQSKAGSRGSTRHERRCPIGQTVADHRAILASIQNGDNHSAELHMRRHLQRRDQHLC